MTLRELYEKIGGNYDQAMRIMRMDKMLDRYIRRLKSSGVGEKLAAAGETMDGAQLFESAHAMKGVCANLGLDELAAAAEEITEEFRPGAQRRLSDAEVKEKLRAVARRYGATVEVIRQYEEEAS